MSEYFTVYVVAPVGLAVTIVPEVEARPPDAGADQVNELDAIVEEGTTVSVTVCGPQILVGFTVAFSVG